ncbi:MAG: hypothetical protein SGI77_15665 [Pirellulaceae bacterium]|nr:hypothetical protein [Pirellulaceae bacterium]
MSTDIPSQINIELGQLPLDAQQRVLEFARSLKRLGTGMSVDTLKKHFGSIDPDEGRLMREAIEAGCEQVNLDEW